VGTRILTVCFNGTNKCTIGRGPRLNGHQRRQPSDLRDNLKPVRSEIDVDGCHMDGTIPTGLRAASSAKFGIDPTSPLDQQAADNQPGRPARYWVDLDSGTAGWEETDDLSGDSCRINDVWGLSGA
jgi:hypothetical protein